MELDRPRRRAALAPFLVSTRRESAMVCRSRGISPGPENRRMNGGEPKCLATQAAIIQSMPLIGGTYTNQKVRPRACYAAGFTMDIRPQGSLAAMPLLYVSKD